MIITECNIKFVNNQKGLIAFASIVINNDLCLSSIAIHQKLNGGYRLTYPKKALRDIFYPINKKTTETIENTIFNKLKDVINDDRYNNNFTRRI